MVFFYDFMLGESEVVSYFPYWIYKESCKDFGLSIWWLQAQMARQAEQDPTNLYIANLPHTIKENDLETLFNPYGQAGVYILENIIGGELLTGKMTAWENEITRG